MVRIHFAEVSVILLYGACVMRYNYTVENRHDTCDMCYNDDGFSRLYDAEVAMTTRGEKNKKY